jgi:hypothetical protein
MAMSAPAMAIRGSGAPEAAGLISGRPSEPTVYDPARSALSHIVSTSQPPRIKSVQPKSEPVSGVVAEPRTVNPPQVSEPPQMMPPAKAKVRISRANVGVAMPAAALKTPPVPGVAKPTVQARPAPPSKSAAAAGPRPVRMAMAPTIRLIDHSLMRGGSIACPPPPQKDAKARTEKRLMPISGKVKLRDLLSKLGGLLFWDQSTRTVTAYMPNMTLEMRIGSSTVRVNGKTMRIDAAPELVDGRTIIDVGVYHQACAFAAANAARAARAF